MAELIVRLGDRVISRHPIDKEVLSIGRARDNDIVIENLSVSRNHTKIKAIAGEFSVLDMNSANGTLLNGVRITKADLANDDIITIGKHTIQFVGGPISVNSKPPTTVAVREGTASLGVLVPPPADKPTGMIGVLTVREGKQAGQQFRVFKAETVIGRAPESDVRIHDWFVSKRHAIIARSGDTYTLKDLDSWRGLSVNGKQVKEADLRSGDQVMISAVVLDFAISNAGDVPEPPSAPPIEGSSSDRVPRPSPNDFAPVAEVEPIASASSSRNTQSAAAIPLPPAPVTFSSAPTALPAGTNLPSEFSPPTNEDELSALEREAETHLGTTEEETENRRSTWELEESERMFETNALDEGNFTLMDSDSILTAEEEVAVGPQHIVFGPEAMARFIGQHAADIETLDAAEEQSLYRKGFTGEAPLGEPLDGSGTEQPDSTPSVAAVRRPSGDQVSQPSGISRLPAAAASGTNPLPIFVGENSPEVTMWEKALKNKSALIRKNAAKELKKLTGKDYDWQSEPGGP